MGQRKRIDSSKACPRTPPGPMKDLTLYLRPNPILVAVSLTLILMTSGFAYYWMLPLPSGDDGVPPELTPHAAIGIDGDANFTATALLEGWPGDGSPKDPFIIDRLEIDLGGGEGHCIMIRNTRFSFTISNCNLTGANLAAAPAAEFVPPIREYPRCILNVGAGIHLYNVSNGELVSNTCNNNTERGFYLYGSDSNIVTNNTCSSNTERGIWLSSSNSNTVASNTCNENGRVGIYLWASHASTVANNTCNNNDVGINLDESDHNTLTNNICTNNRIGIYIDDEPESNTVENNTFSSNTEHDIVYESELEELAHQEYVAKQSVWFLAGCGMVLVVAVIAFVQFRRMKL
jgi:parallel beta-helix repeat protein